MKLYHGSNVSIETIDLKRGRKGKDFGRSANQPLPIAIYPNGRADLAVVFYSSYFSVFLRNKASYQITS